MLRAFEKTFHSVQQRADDAFGKSGTDHFYELFERYIRVAALVFCRLRHLPHRSRYDGIQILLSHRRYLRRDRFDHGLGECRTPTTACDGQRKPGSDWFCQFGPQLLLEARVLT